MRQLTLVGLTLVAGLALLLSACGMDPDTFEPTFRSALTGEPCDPDPATYVPLYPEGTTFEEGKPWKPEKQDGLERNPTGMNGDNMDDAASGRTDCFWDGNSGHGDDKKHECIPPGCDENLCCDERSGVGQSGGPGTGSNGNGNGNGGGDEDEGGGTGSGDEGDGGGGGDEGEGSGDGFTCSEEHPELCPGGVYPGDGATGSGGGDDGDDSDDGAGGGDDGDDGDDGAGGGGGDTPEDGGGEPGDNPGDVPVCSEEHPELCPDGVYPGDGSDGSSTDGGGDGSGDGTGDGDTSTCTEENLADCM